MFSFSLWALESSAQVRNLGVVLDSDLNFQSHGTNIKVLATVQYYIIFITELE